MKWSTHSRRVDPISRTAKPLKPDHCASFGDFVTSSTRIRFSVDTGDFSSSSDHNLVERCFNQLNAFRVADARHDKRPRGQSSIRESPSPSQSSSNGERDRPAEGSEKHISAVPSWRDTLLSRDRHQHPSGAGCQELSATLRHRMRVILLTAAYKKGLDHALLFGVNIVRTIEVEIGAQHFRRYC